MEDEYISSVGLRWLKKLNVLRRKKYWQDRKARGLRSWRKVGATVEMHVYCQLKCIENVFISVFSSQTTNKALPDRKGSS